MYTKTLAIICLTFISCSGGYVEGVSQKAEKAFLQFTGNVDYVTVSIDDSETFALERRKEKKDVVYEVKPGNHRLKIYRNNQLIVDRVVFVDNQTTMEIKVP